MNLTKIVWKSFSLGCTATMSMIEDVPSVSCGWEGLHEYHYLLVEVSAVVTL